MDINSLRKVIEGQLTQLSGNSFQDACDRLGLILYPRDYNPVRAGGNRGDDSNDGYCPKARLFFAAHATRRESAGDSKSKIQSDLEGCLRKHRDVKIWRFITNDTLRGEVETFIDNELRPAHPEITIETWGQKKLADVASELPVEAINKIFDLNLPPSQVQSPKADLLGTINDINIKLLTSLNLCEHKDVQPQLGIFDFELKVALASIDHFLAPTERLFGADSEYSKLLNEIAKALKAYFDTENAIGMASYNDHQQQLKSASAAAHSLLLQMRETVSVQVQGLDEHVSDTVASARTWLNGIGYDPYPFFEKAGKFGNALVHISYLLSLSQRESEAEKFKKLGDNILLLSWDSRSGNGDQLEAGIKDFKSRLNNIG